MRMTISCGRLSCSTNSISRASRAPKGCSRKPVRKTASMRRRTRSLRSGTISRSRRGGRRISMRILADVIRLSNCAIERDPQNALALAIQGHGKSMFFRDYDSGLDLCERALAISPSNSWAWVFGSGTPGFVGDASTGIARAERAIRLSPLGQQAFFNFCLLGQNHYLNGTFDDAIRWSKKSLSSQPAFWKRRARPRRKPRRCWSPGGSAAGFAAP